MNIGKPLFFIPSQPWWRHTTMTKQLSLFPASPEDPAGSLLDDKIAALATALNPVDEIFASTIRYQNIRILTEMLAFIARFPNYSPFNGLLLYIQNPEATYVATARNWLQNQETAKI